MKFKVELVNFRWNKKFILGGFEHFTSNIDPEELFRKIFGDAGFNMGGFSNFGGQSDFAESQFGFSPASEVCKTYSLTKNQKYNQFYVGCGNVLIS